MSKRIHIDHVDTGAVLGHGPGLLPECCGDVMTHEPALDTSPGWECPDCGCSIAVDKSGRVTALVICRGH